MISALITSTALLLIAVLAVMMAAQRYRPDDNAPAVTGPDAALPLLISDADLSKHLALFGETSTGMTFGHISREIKELMQNAETSQPEQLDLFPELLEGVTPR